MAFISNKIDLIGTIQRLKKDVCAIKGTILKGSAVVVLDKDAERGYSIRDIDSGEEMHECGFNIFEGQRNG